MPIFIECFFAKSSKSGKRAIVPSSLIISQITADGVRVARLAISIDASVCPGRTKTPPSFATIGKICPGLTRSLIFAAGFIAVLIVCARSKADIPVVIPSLASIDLVKHGKGIHYLMAMAM